MMLPPQSAVLTLGLAICLLAATPCSAQQDSLKTQKTTLLVPAYFYPGGAGLVHWRKLIAAAADVPIVAIANPNSGPGTQRNDNYSEVIKAAADAGVRVIGYVSTNYGKRTLPDVSADIDRWLQFYPDIDGIFLDEQASATQHVGHYVGVSRHIHDTMKRPLIVSNPGVICAAEYFTCGALDVICVFENRTGFSQFRAPRRKTGDHTGRCVLLHEVGTAERMRQSLRHANSQGVRYVYITDDHGANPWDRLPTYWEDEVAAIKQ